MKIKIEAYYLACEATQGKKDPSKTYYTALFMQGIDTLQINCANLAYEKLRDVPPMTLTTMETDYNTQYQYFRLEDVTFPEPVPDP